MKVQFFGTRGSVPVARSDTLKYGGNTTSLEVFSQCLPPNHHLVVDAGSGIVPLCQAIMKAEGAKFFNGDVPVTILFSHWHHDHTQGLPLAPMTFLKKVKINLYGPVDAEIGPREMMKTIMRKPFFPVDFKEIGAHFQCHNLDNPNCQIIVVHPVGGWKLLTVEAFERQINDGGHIPVGKAGKYPVNECLVIRMFESNHPENTVSYRFEERPTGKAFVFLTDHENQAGIPQSLRNHCLGANMLILDAQYTQKKYDEMTSGWGHGTGPYCANLAWQCEAQNLGLTHHDPFSSDEMVEQILQEAKEKTLDIIAQNPEARHPLMADNIFACADYQELEI